jgi:hypothetical protein
MVALGTESPLNDGQITGANYPHDNKARDGLKELSGKIFVKLTYEMSDAKAAALAEVFNKWIDAYTESREKQVELNTLWRLNEEYVRRNLGGDVVSLSEIIHEHINALTDNQERRSFNG